MANHLASQELAAASPKWFRSVLHIAGHFWHNHKVIGTFVIGFATAMGWPVWSLGLLATFFGYITLAHTAHGHGSRLWRRRRWLIFSLKAGLVLLGLALVSSLALFGAAIWLILTWISR